ncbi:MAG TPA: trypsin-like peptidase domain-containing protein [Gemmataceae bacterium]|jgi:S1-C subfamily serine protease
MKWTTALIVPALLLAAGVCRADSKTENDIRRSVVRISASQRYPNLLKPWMKNNPREVAGTGVVLDGQRILTNAHLVAYAKQIYVEPYQSSDKLAATVERIAPGIDLALLKVEDATFWKNRPPLPKAAGLPEGKDAVSVYGYPVGGTSLAVTRGAVARISYGAYASEFGLQIQIDAAVNPGNSGGPALVKDRMIGVVIGASTEGQNIGYLIPNEEIDSFLKGNSGSKPRIMDELQSLQNDALRGRLKLDRGTRGLLVRAPASADPSYPLKKGDVLMRIGSYDVDNDGMVRVQENLRLEFPYVVPRAARGDRVPVTLLRQGRRQVIDLPVVRQRRLLMRPLDGTYPSYFVYGPLVFSPASSSLGRVFESQASEGSPLQARWNSEVAFEGEELVVVTALLPHKLGKGYGDPSGQVVKQVNGTRIRNLRHLVETLRKVTDPYVEFEFHEKYVEALVFERKEVLAAMDDILSDNNIGQPCSADLRAAWQGNK